MVVGPFPDPKTETPNGKMPLPSTPVVMAGEFRSSLYKIIRDKTKATGSSGSRDRLVALEK